MEFRHLQALTAISDHGTFSAAAEHLNTVQSNISAHVARLERELGAPLIDRSDGRLTEEGTVVVARARRILHELDALVSDVAACKDEVTGTVRVGMIGTTARWLVPRLMDVVRKRHPKLRLVVMEGTTTGLEPQLASGQLDLAVLNLPVTAKDGPSSRRTWCWWCRTATSWPPATVRSPWRTSPTSNCSCRCRGRPSATSSTR
jgi:LysR family hydrogen peroxide-inducible transcriptional activator